MRTDQPSTKMPVVDFIRKHLTQFEFKKDDYGRNRLLPSKRFCLQLGVETRMMISTLDVFRQHLFDYGFGSHVKVTDTPVIEGEVVDLKVREGWLLHDYQIKIKDFIINNPHVPSKLIAIQTGKGKTFTALATTAELNLRTLIIIKASYIDKWIDDVYKILEVEKEELLVLQGSKDLKKVAVMAAEGRLTSKVIIVSNVTVMRFLKEYELSITENATYTYDITPEEFFSVMKVGTVIVDEVHQFFHLNVLILLYCNVQNYIALSATLLDEDKFLSNMYNMAFPSGSRYDSLELDKYIRLIPIGYQFYSLKHIRTTEYGSNKYSHVAFEKSILKNKGLTEAYLTMIDFYVYRGYLVDKQEGEKLIIFAALVDMCTLITNHLKKKHPDLSVARYVGSDPYDNVISPDIRVTTLGSAGTAVDIPGLITTINTVSVGSWKLNIQALGRLRKREGRETRYIYLYCESIKKHLTQHDDRMKLLGNRCASTTSYFYPITLGVQNVN